MFKKIFQTVFALTAAVVMGMTFISCESTGGTNSTPASEINISKLPGTYFWDYGFDQSEFGNEQLTLNKDGTCSMFSIGPDWSEFDKGNYSVVDDEKYGKTLVLNLLNWKEKVQDEWGSCNVKLTYILEKINDNEIIMHRTARDFSAQGGGIDYADPPIYQHYLRVKDGDASSLTGTWKMNKRLFQDMPFEVKWTLNEDGTLINEKFTEDDSFVREGVWNVEKNKQGSTLHVNYTTANGEADSEEYWYEYFSIGENLNELKCFKQKINGKEEPVETDAVFYYREIPLLTYTYTLSNAQNSYSFNDYFPANKDYELLQTNRRYMFKKAANAVNRMVIDWYDNPDFSGSPVTDISALNNTKSREFWGKLGIKFNRNEWNPSDINYGHNFAVDFAVPLIFPDMKIPQKGDVVKIALSATVDKNIKGIHFEIIDYSEGWNAIGNKFLKIEPVENTISLFVEIPIDKNPQTDLLSKIGFNMYYMHDELDETCALKDIKLKLIDDSSSAKVVEHKLYYGNKIITMNSLSEFPFILPARVEQLEGLIWQLSEQTELVGWYDNPEFTGNPVKVVSTDSNTEGKSFYGRYILKNNWSEMHDNGQLYSNIQIPVTSVMPKAKINLKAGDVLKVAVSADLSQDYEGQMGLDLFTMNVDDGFKGNDWHYVKTKDKKLQTCFEIKINNDTNFASMDDACFLFAYNPVSKNDLLTLANFKFEIVDEDPFVTETAETPHLKVEPCEEGFKFTVRKLSSDNLKLDERFNLYTNSRNYELDANIQQKAVEENGSVSFIWPFCEKGKAYKFEITWTDANGKWNYEMLKVRAKNGKGELNGSALDKIKLHLESNSKEADVCAKNLTKENVLDLVKKYLDELQYVNIETPFIAGKNDWSNTEWLYGHESTIYPEFDGNTFYSDLMTKGKANIFGDHDFWWGDKKEFMNQEFSKYNTFWTRLNIFFKTNNNPDCVEFYTISHVTDTTPYTPVKF